ncbi:hypothetical protein NIES22_71600 (plasmid) [Calothrix brevissima NIES-22]|nr:hypothetical protein NIES22_71600 [Calothrix brevissima NIES-22]
MAEVLVEPQFQVVTHIQTGAKTGRIYFPALFLAEFYSSVIKWLQRQEIHFSEQDLKKYGDGSFRLYFRTAKSPEIEYLELIAILKNLHNSYS